MTPEGKVQAYLKKLVQASGGEFRKVSWEGRRSAPDCLIWWTNGYARPALVECKRLGKEPTDAQEREMVRLRYLPIVVAWVDSEESVDKLMTMLTR